MSSRAENILRIRNHDFVIYTLIVSVVNEKARPSCFNENNFK